MVLWLASTEMYTILFLPMANCLNKVRFFNELTSDISFLFKLSTYR